MDGRDGEREVWEGHGWTGRQIDDGMDRARIGRQVGNGMNRGRIGRQAGNGMNRGWIGRQAGNGKGIDGQT